MLDSSCQSTLAAMLQVANCRDEHAGPNEVLPSVEQEELRTICVAVATRTYEELDKAMMNR